MTSAPHIGPRSGEQACLQPVRPSKAASHPTPETPGGIRAPIASRRGAPDTGPPPKTPSFFEFISFMLHCGAPSSMRTPYFNFSVPRGWPRAGQSRWRSLTAPDRHKGLPAHGGSPTSSGHRTHAKCGKSPIGCIICPGPAFSPGTLDWSEMEGGNGKQ
jgi:hypothetical protein